MEENWYRQALLNLNLHLNLNLYFYFCFYFYTNLNLYLYHSTQVCAANELFVRETAVLEIIIG